MTNYHDYIQADELLREAQMLLGNTGVAKRIRAYLDEPQGELTTDELLEALRERLTVNGIVSLTATGDEDGWEVCLDPDDAASMDPFPGRILRTGPSPADALRAALRAVS